MLLTDWVLLKVVVEHQHDSCDFLPREEVKHLRSLLDDSQSVVLEVLVGKLMVTQDPEDHHNVVTNLGFLEAWTFKVRDNDIERGPIFAENLGELVCL